MLQDNYELVVDSNTDVSTSILCNTYTDSICVWEFVQQYEMKLKSLLSNSQRENMESDFEENFFFKFMDEYPGYNFVCLVKLKYYKLPMIY